MADTTTASRIVTDPKVQAAWIIVEQALHDYGQTCLKAALDPELSLLLSARVARAELVDGDDVAETLALYVRVPRGSIGNPREFVARRLQVRV